MESNIITLKYSFAVSYQIKHILTIQPEIFLFSIKEEKYKYIFLKLLLKNLYATIYSYFNH
jgi:hypothetical protein